MCYCDDTKLPPAVQMTVLCSYLALKRTLLLICSLEFKMVWFTSTGRSKRAKLSIQTADFTSPVKVPHYSVNNINCSIVCTCVCMCPIFFFILNAKKRSHGLQLLDSRYQYHVTNQSREHSLCFIWSGRKHWWYMCIVQIWRKTDLWNNYVFSWHICPNYKTNSVLGILMVDKQVGGILCTIYCFSLLESNYICYTNSEKSSERNTTTINSKP